MAQVLRHITQPSSDRDPDVLVGSETFDDAGVYRLTPDLAIVQTLDLFPPVLDDPFAYGQIAASNALSDVYAMGGIPKTALNIVGFPDDELPLEVLSKILSGGSERIAAAGASLIGGHTIRDAEIKYGLSVTGTIHPDRILTNTHARPGDVLFLTKPLGTGFATTAHKADKCPEETLAAASRTMIALNDAGARAMQELDVRAATDVTGFGLAGHAHEIAAGSGVTLEIDLSSLPLIEGCEELVKQKYFTRASQSNADHVKPHVREETGLDPVRREFIYDPQTSGGILMCVPESRVSEVPEILKKHETLAAARIGHVTERTDEAVHLHIRA